MDNSLKGLILATGVIITCIVVGLGFYLSREAQNSGSTAIDQISNMTSEYQEVGKTMYDGLNVSGSEVLEVVKKFSEEIKAGGFTVTVFTGKKNSSTSGIVFGTGFTDFSDNQKKSGENYINPNGKFIGKTELDENGVVKSITFTQQ